MIFRPFSTCIIFVCLYMFPTVALSKSCSDYSSSEDIGKTQLWLDFDFLASNQFEGRKTQTRGAQLTREFLSKRFSSIGLLPLGGNVNFNLRFSYVRGFSQSKGINVAGYVEGKIYPDEFLVVTAHYDHLGKVGSRIFNGADDNASGVAALLSLASYAKKQGTDYSIIFLATDAEEQGLYGAKAFVKNPPVPLSSIRANLNLDMLSQNRGKNRLYVSGSKYFPELQPSVDMAIDTAGLCLVDGHRSLRRGSIVSSRINWRQASDHAAFAKVGIPYLFVGVTEHPYYHTVNDTVDKVNPDFYFAAVDTSLKLLVLLDQIKFE